MMRSSAGIVLWNVKGQSLLIGSGEWDIALQVATARGWQPRGTRRPPISLDDEPQPAWDGRYAPALGQEVTAADAIALAKTLEKAAPSLSAGIAKLSSFASSGGFIVCAPAANVSVPPPNQHTQLDLIALMRSLSSAGKGSRPAPTKTPQHTPVDAVSTPYKQETTQR